MSVGVKPINFFNPAMLARVWFLVMGHQIVGRGNVIGCCVGGGGWQMGQDKRHQLVKTNRLARANIKNTRGTMQKIFILLLAGFFCMVKVEQADHHPHAIHHPHKITGLVAVGNG